MNDHLKNPSDTIDESHHQQIQQGRFDFELKSEDYFENFIFR